MKGIDDLPVYVWPIIFSNLSLSDLFNCRLVNKKFKNFSNDSKGINKLVLRDVCLVEDQYWYYNNKLMEDQDIISSKGFEKIRSLSLFNLDRYLKYLKIIIPFHHFDNLKNLKNLNNLQVLEIKTNELFINKFQNGKIILNFLNLEILIIEHKSFNQNNSDFFFELNAPKLKKIKLNKLNKIQFKSNPKSIDHLITAEYQDQLKICTNLEIIEFIDLKHNLDENFFTNFNNLKQLKIHHCSSIDNLNGFFNIKSKLKRDYDLYLCGVKILNVDKLNQFSLFENELEFQIKNYDLLDSNLTEIKTLDYNELENCFDNLINDVPLSFFNKYRNVFQVNVLIEVKNSDNLNWFLKNFKFLNTLTIDEPSLDQLFYDNLNDNMNTLYIFRSNTDINYNFILKLNKLTRIHLDHDNDFFDLALESFRKLKNLFSFDFIYKNRKILIIAKTMGDIRSYSIQSNRNIEENLDYGELENACKKIRSELKHL